MRPFGPSMKLGPSLSTDVFELNIQVTLEIFTQGCEYHDLALPAQCGYMNGVVLLSQLLHMKTINILLHPIFTWQFII